LTIESLAALIVSDERRDWILERYPPTDIGRPGIVHVEKRKAVRKLDDDAPAVAGEDWRATFEFDGNEDALEVAAG